MNTKTITSLAVAAFATAGIMAMTSSAALAAGNSATASGAASAVVITPITLTHNSVNELRFGKFTVGTTPGTVILTPAGGRSVSGGVSLLFTPPADVSADAFGVAGGANRLYTITLPGPTPLSDGVSSTMTVGTFGSAASVPGPATDGSGNGSFTVGATLNVGAGQTAGIYSGLYSVTVTYQ